jgi:hypothetical protein
VERLYDVDILVELAQKYSKDLGVWNGRGNTVVLHGKAEPDADSTPVLRAIECPHHSRTMDYNRSLSMAC